MISHHQYYRCIINQSSNPSDFANWLYDQSSSIGLALAYIAQTLFVTAITISSSQVFWCRLRSREHTVSEIDALMKAQVNPFTPLSFRAAKASFGVLLLALLSTAMSAVSVFAPNSINYSVDKQTSEECLVPSLRNLTSLTTDNSSDYSTPIGTVLSLGTYIPPTISNLLYGFSVYDLEFVGPGYDCKDVTASSDYAAFADWTPGPGPGFGNMTNIYNAYIVPQTSDLTIQLSVQTRDMERSLYQAVNCIGVTRSYSVTVMPNAPPIINVLESRLISPVLAQPGVDLSRSPGDGNISFVQDYIVGGMTVLTGSIATGIDGSAQAFNLPSFIQVADSQITYIGGLGSFLENGNFAWRENMTVALEDYAQNLTLSLLSGQIFLSNNTEEPTLLENTTATCAYTINGFEYTPSRLFLTYGIAAFVTLLCVAWGTIAIQINGTEESMNFSRFLRAVLNERMYHWYEGEGFKLDMNARIKADETSEGALAPIIDGDSKIDLFSHHHHEPDDSIPLVLIERE